MCKMFNITSFYKQNEIIFHQILSLIVLIVNSILMLNLFYKSNLILGFAALMLVLSFSAYIFINYYKLSVKSISYYLIFSLPMLFMALVDPVDDIAVSTLSIACTLYFTGSYYEFIKKIKNELYDNIDIENDTATIKNIKIKKEDAEKYIVDILIRWYTNDLSLLYALIVSSIILYLFKKPLESEIDSFIANILYVFIFLVFKACYYILYLIFNMRQDLIIYTIKSRKENSIYDMCSKYKYFNNKFFR